MFPTKRPDGTFTVVALFSATDESVVALVERYVSVWCEANRQWTRIWRSSDIVREDRRLEEDFLADPRVSDVSAKSFAIVFEGRKDSPRWKDWAVRLVGEVEKVFSEVKFLEFESR